MLRNTLLVAVSLLVTLALCEGFLRIFGQEMLPKPDLYELDPVTGKSMRPGWTGDEFGAPVVINSLGLRNPEISYARSPGRYRILALGDSWTFGFRLEEPDSYPRQLETVLNQRARGSGEPAKFEVINTGVIGYSTEQEAAYLRERGVRFDPDLIVVAFYPVNDTHHKLRKYERYNRLRAIHPLLLELYKLPRRLYLRQFIKGARQAIKRRAVDFRDWLNHETISDASHAPIDASGTRKRFQKSYDNWSDAYRPGHSEWEAARAAILEIGEISRSIGADVLVVLLPDLPDLSRYEFRDHPRVEPLLREAVAEAGLDWLDLLDTLRPWSGREEEIQFSGLRHPNARGYRIIAEAVADRIESLYLNPARDRGEASEHEPDALASR